MLSTGKKQSNTSSQLPWLSPTELLVIFVSMQFRYRSSHPYFVTPLPLFSAIWARVLHFKTGLRTKPIVDATFPLKNKFLNGIYRTYTSKKPVWTNFGCGEMCIDELIHSLCSYHSIISLGGSGVDQLGTVLHHLLDQSLLLQFSQGFSCQRTSDLQTLRDNCRCDQLVGWDFL